MDRLFSTGPGTGHNLLKNREIRSRTVRYTRHWVRMVRILETKNKHAHYYLVEVTDRGQKQGVEDYMFATLEEATKKFNSFSAKPVRVDRIKSNKKG